MSVLDESPFPFQKPEAQQFWLALSDQFLDERETKQIAQRHQVEPATLTPNLSARNLWHEILWRASGFGTVRDLAVEVRAKYKGASFAFLDALIANLPNVPAPAPVVVTRETSPTGDAPPLTVGSSDVGQDEARLFNDAGLWEKVGLLPALIGTLQEMVRLAPSVCHLRVSGPGPVMLGTGFRISKDWVLSNHHVLKPRGATPFRVEADFNFDVDATDTTTHQQPPLKGDVSTIVGEYDDANGERVDWAVIRVPGLDPAGPVFDLSRDTDPTREERTFVLQHPGGENKRLGFVRNVITFFDARVIHYLTDTEEGSSGSPVLDAKGRVLALHRGAGESGTFGGKYPVKKNEGIRITRLRSRLIDCGALK